jgi:hypothetical protein
MTTDREEDVLAALHGLDTNRWEEVLDFIRLFCVNGGNPRQRRNADPAAMQH